VAPERDIAVSMRDGNPLGPGVADAPARESTPFQFIIRFALTLSISDADVVALSRMDRIVEAVESAALEEHDGLVIMPERSNLMHERTLLRIMSAYLRRSGVFGYKSFHGSMAKGVRYMIVLCRESDGEILALLDAAHLTGLRTGATSAVATKYMAREGPATVGLIGSGLEATTNLAAVATVRPIERGWVYSRNSDRRKEFARRVREEMGIEFLAVDTPDAAVRDASIVLVATNTGYGGPVAYRGEWLRHGQHVVSIGSTSPFLREVDSATGPTVWSLTHPWLRSSENPGT